jgi:hypothetical protein
MNGAIPPLPQYVSMAWCSVKSTGTTLSFTFTFKGPLGRHSCRLEDNIRMELREIGWVGMDWNRLAEDRDQWWALVNMIP